MKVHIVDYGMGNLWSVVNAFRFFGVDARVSSSPPDVALADAIVLPGVGSFRLAMHALRSRGLDEAINNSVLHRGRKILGVCLGFQILAQAGTEDGGAEGLGYLRGTVSRFERATAPSLKLPHIGFNQVAFPMDAPLFRGLAADPYFYFVHSYRLLPHGIEGSVATAHHGETFVAAYSHENVFGTQFHPEKSQTNGLRLIKNFLDA